VTALFRWTATPIYERAKQARHKYRSFMPYGQILDAGTFVPLSKGGARARARLTLQAADQTFPFLTGFLEATGRPTLSPIPAGAFDPRHRDAAEELKTLFDQYGSDKSTIHNYHLVYGAILADTSTLKAVLEIGLGTNHRDVVSHMGSRGRPGASLRAFRDFLPNAQIFGADIDRRVLFTEERIQTSWVDQTRPETVDALPVPDDLDLIIDDGLHTPNANIAVLTLAMRKLRPGGSVVIEDITAAAVPVWQVVAALMPTGWAVTLIDGGDGFLFVARRPA
jgi:SAM-dependent methyltransferase